MSDVRCRACGAAVPAQAQWCSLCYADLRQPAPVREPVTVAAAPTAGPEAAAASASPAPARMPQPPRHEARWPCRRCGATVLMSLDECPDCGAGFLADASEVASTRLPLVGDLRRMSHGQRMLIAGAIACVLTLLFLVLAEVGGHIFS